MNRKYPTKDAKTNKKIENANLEEKICLAYNDQDSWYGFCIALDLMKMTRMKKWFTKMKFGLFYLSNDRPYMINLLCGTLSAIAFSIPFVFIFMYGTMNYDTPSEATLRICSCIFLSILLIVFSCWLYVQIKSAFEGMWQDIKIKIGTALYNR